VTTQSIAQGSDTEGNLWEARHIANEYHLYENNIYRATMSTRTNILLLLSEALRPKVTVTICGDCLIPLSTCQHRKDYK